MYDHNPVDVAKALNEYLPASPLEKKLIGCFKKGVLFISLDNSIMNYDYDVFSECIFDEYEDYPPITPDRTVRYVYDMDDFVTKELEYMVNQNLQESYAMEPVSSMILTPDSKRFIYDDYPERFSQWFFDMIETTKEITAEITAEITK